jgi:pilus assembly protein CpaE
VSRTVRVIVVNADEEVAPELRAALLGVAGVRIVAEIDEPALLPQALDQFPAEVLLVHLDPQPAAMMDVVAPLLETRKDRLAAIGITEDRDADLVVRAMRAGMREFLWKPLPPEQLGEILQRVGSEACTDGRRLGRLFVVVGTCGGVGATTLATNLAVELAQIEGWVGAPNPVARPRVALVDLDFRFGQAAIQLDAQPAYTIAELCESPERIDPQMIERAMFKHPSGVHLLARPADFAQAEQISAAQAAGVLATLQEHYDFVVVDMPMRFDSSARAVFDMADTYLLVLQLLVPSVRNADRILQALDQSGYASERIRLVCNRFGRESGYLETADVEATLRRKLSLLLPDDWKASSTAVNMGAPLLSHAPKAKLRLAYREIAWALALGAEAADGSGDEGAGSSRKGLFSFLAAK